MKNREIESYAKELTDILHRINRCLHRTGGRMPLSVRAKLDRVMPRIDRLLPVLTLHGPHKANGHQRLTASRELTSEELTKLLWALRN